MRKLDGIGSSHLDLLVGFCLLLDLLLIRNLKFAGVEEYADPKVILYAFTNASFAFGVRVGMTSNLSPRIFGGIPSQSYLL